MPATARAQVLAPETCWDTCVTIGSTNGNFDFLLVLAPTFGEQTDNLAGDFTLDDSGWATWAFNPNGLTVDDRVLVAQLTVANGVAITGTDWLVSYQTDPGGPATFRPPSIESISQYSRRSRVRATGRAADARIGAAIHPEHVSCVSSFSARSSWPR